MLGCIEIDEKVPDGNTPGFAVVIRADSNRDGQVDVAGQSDEADKMLFTKDRGALFLANLDDDASRCAAQAKRSECFDAADEVVNGPEDVRDLARVKTLPLEVSSEAVGTLTVVSKKADAVRIFVEKTPGQFVAIPSGHQFQPEELRKGLSLAVEGKAPAMDVSVWDGHIELHYEVKDQEKRAVDKVAMKVAPLLTHTHSDTIKHFIAAPSTVDLNIKNFRRDLELALNEKGFAPKHSFLEIGDEWAQDWVEPLYASIPGSDGPISMHVLLGSDQERVEAYQALYTLAGPNVGVALLSQSKSQAMPGKSGSYSSFGNLETIPPYAGYPAGRQVVGGNQDKSEGPSAKTMKFLQAQGVQDPIWLDSSWLEVGHIDEFLSFLPAKDAALGFKIVIVDPLLALEILKKADQEGHGGVLLNSFKPETESAKEMVEGNQLDLSVTIRQFLDKPKELEAQQKVAALIATNLAILKQQTQIPDKDILRIPGLFQSVESFDFPSGYYSREEGSTSLRSVLEEIEELQAKHADGLRSHGRLLAGLSARPKLQMMRWLTEPKERSAQLRQEDVSVVYKALVPDAVNMVVSPVGQALIPKQFGPVVGGQDIFAAAIQEQLGSSGYQALFVDDFITYHLAGGEVHCASNTIREPRAQWWTKN